MTFQQQYSGRKRKGRSEHVPREVASPNSARTSSKYQHLRDKFRSLDCQLESSSFNGGKRGVIKGVWPFLVCQLGSTLPVYNPNNAISFTSAELVFCLVHFGGISSPPIHSNDALEVMVIAGRGKLKGGKADFEQSVDYTVAFFSGC